MNNPQSARMLGIVYLCLILIFIFALLSLNKSEPNKKETKKDFNFNSCKQIQQTELTYETLKLYRGFENTSELEAPKQIEAIKRLAKILYYLHLNEQ